MTERQKKFDLEHPYHDMTLQEIEDWVTLQQKRHLPDREPARPTIATHDYSQNVHGNPEASLRGNGKVPKR